MARRSTSSNRGSGRRGQAILELSVTFLIWWFAMLLVLDIIWMLYHYAVLQQATTRTARYAAENYHASSHIEDFFEREVRVTTIPTGDADLYSFVIDVRENDPAYAHEDNNLGEPSVLIEARYVHRWLVPIPVGLASLMSIRSTSKAMIHTWATQPTPMFADYSGPN